MHESFQKRDNETAVVFPSSLSQDSCVKSLLPKLDKENIRDNLETFSGFQNRWYESETGKESSEWLFSQIQAVVNSSEAKEALVQTYEHDWEQSSIIVTVPGKTDNIIVVGSHIDTISLDDDDLMNQRAPGADDDGSGTMTILEALRVLLSDSKIAGGEADNTIEFHWYAAEEPGLLGSQAIFENYKKKNKAVKAMLNQDMTGYVKNGTTEHFGVITDHVNARLTTFIKKVIDAVSPISPYCIKTQCTDQILQYCDIPYVDTKCGYGCSDHASASKAGFPSAFVIESAFNGTNPNIHTEKDVIGAINFNHTIEHAKLVVGFAYELGFTPEF